MNTVWTILGVWFGLSLLFAVFLWIFGKREHRPVSEWTDEHWRAR